MEGRSPLLPGEDSSSSKGPIPFESSSSLAHTDMVHAQQGAQAVPEFKIRVKASDPLGERVHFFLRVKYGSFHFSCGSPLDMQKQGSPRNSLVLFRFPKTYPRVLPTLTVEEPVGLSKTQVNQLLNAIKAEGQKTLGEVMVFQVCGSLSFFSETIPNTPHDAACHFQPRMDYEPSHATNRG